MNTETKLSRDELKQRLRMAQMRGKLGRMPKKQRDEKVEQLKADMEEQQSAFMEQIKLLTPEQRKAMGIPETEVPKVSTDNAQIIHPENQQPVSESNPMVIPIQFPKMTQVSSNQPNPTPVSESNPIVTPIQFPKMTPVSSNQANPNPVNTPNTMAI